MGIQIILLHYKTILKMQLDLVNADCKYNNAFSLGGRFAFKFPSLAKRYNILTDTPKSSAKSFGS